MSAEQEQVNNVSPHPSPPQFMSPRIDKGQQKLRLY